jgi:hypothetical protein
MNSPPMILWKGGSGAVNVRGVHANHRVSFAAEHRAEAIPHGGQRREDHPRKNFRPQKAWAAIGPQGNANSRQNQRGIEDLDGSQGRSEPEPLDGGGKGRRQATRQQEGETRAQPWQRLK